MGDCEQVPVEITASPGRVEAMGSTGAREDPGETPVFRGKEWIWMENTAQDRVEMGFPPGPELSGA